MDKETVRRAKIEVARRAQMRLYRQEPDRWYVERFGGKITDLKWSMWPEYADHQWDGTPDPFYKACMAISKWKNCGIESGTGTGKTYLTARIAYWFLDVFPDSLVVTTAPKERQLKAILWSEMAACFGRFKRIRPRAEMFDLRILPDGAKVKFGANMRTPTDDDEYSNLHQMIGVVAGVRAGEESATKMQGFHRKYMLIILEEAAGVPLPVLTAINQTVTGEFNPVLGIGNPDSVSDALHQLCMTPGTEHIRISAYDHPNIVCGHTVIDGAVSQKSIDIRTRHYGIESNLFQSRIRGISPEQATDSLIMAKWIRQICRFLPDFDRAKYKPQDVSYPAVGVDVANSLRGDEACLAWGTGSRLVSLHEFVCPNATDLADNIWRSDDDLVAKGLLVYGTDKISTYQIIPANIGVDGVGVGVATVNQLARDGMVVHSLMGGSDETAIPIDDQEKPLYKFANLRAQMWFQLRIDLQNGDFSIDILDKSILDQLIRELTIVKYKVENNAILIQKKDKIKEALGGKSPNMGDALVYWNWVRKKRHGQYTREMPIVEADATVEAGTIDPNWDTGSEEFSDFQMPGYNGR